MSTSIIARLDARIAMEPALSDLDTLFTDLADARAAILAGDVALAAATEIKQAVPEPPRNSEGLRLDGPTLTEWLAAGYQDDTYPPAGYVGKDPDQPAISPSILEHVHTLLVDAEERLSVNAIGMVSTYIDNAIKLLEG